MISQEDRVHNAIYTLLSTASFPHVVYDADTGLRSTEATTEVPSTIKIRPDLTTFEPAVGYRRTPRVQDRVSWDWTAVVRWDNQVTLSTFEEEYTGENILLPRTVDFPLQVTIQLVRIEYTHPPEHGSSSGTRAEISFSAVVSRK